jgi:hypothetical protein
MSSALANRFVHLDLDTDVEDWREWALQRRLEPLVVSFIGVRPNLLRQEPGEASAYPTPRSWEMASDVTGIFGGGLAGYRACADVLPGIVGQAAAVEFAGFVKKAASEKQMRAIVDDPAGAPLPDALDGIYLLTSWLAYHVGPAKFIQPPRPYVDGDLRRAFHGAARTGLRGLLLV